MAGKRRFGRVRKLPSGRYQARYRGPDGTDHPAPDTFATKREADRFLALVEADIATGKWYAPSAGRTTLAEWTQQWFAAASPSWKPKTRHTYRGVLDRLVLPELGRVQLADLRPIQVSAWVAALANRLSPSQVRQAYRLLSQLMTAAVDNDLIAATPCRGVRLPRIPEANPRILTVAEVTRLVDACQPADRALVLLLAYGGLRIGEALPLRRRHLDVDDGRVIVADAVTELPGARSSTPRRVTSAASYSCRPLSPRPSETTWPPCLRDRMCSHSPAVNARPASVSRATRASGGASFGPWPLPGWATSRRTTCGRPMPAGWPTRTVSWLRPGGSGTPTPVSPPGTTRGSWTSVTPGRPAPRRPQHGPGIGHAAGTKVSGEALMIGDQCSDLVPPAVCWFRT